MFGIGFTEILAVAVIALIFIGPDDLPKFARTIGRFLNELKRGSDSFVNDIKSATDTQDFDRIERDLRRSLDEIEEPPANPTLEKKEDSHNE